MADISSSNLVIKKVINVGTASGESASSARPTHGKVKYSFRVNWRKADREENLQHRIHVSLWERDGGRDAIHTSYNGSGVSYWHYGTDRFIVYVDGFNLRPNGRNSTFVTKEKQFPVGELRNEPGAEEFYLHIAAHPWSGSIAEDQSNEFPIEF